MSKNSGGPAFPGTHSKRSDEGRGPVTEYHDKGMSLRDYFATHAPDFVVMREITAGDVQRYAGKPYDMLNAVEAERARCGVVARRCYQFADAMLAEREK